MSGHPLHGLADEEPSLFTSNQSPTGVTRSGSLCGHVRRSNGAPSAACQDIMVNPTLELHNVSSRTLIAIETCDIVGSLGMAAKRQERLLERQRGAGTRQIKNTGFDLLLPGQEIVAPPVLSPQKSGRSRKTPQPELLPQRSGRARKTAQPELLPQRSTRRTPAPEAPSSNEIPPQSLIERPPNISNAKKRGRPRNIPVARYGGTDGGDEQGAAPKKRKLNTVSKRTRAVQGANAAVDRIVSPEVQVQDSQPQDPSGDTIPIEEKKKQRKRKPMGQQSLRKIKPEGKSPLKPARQPQKRGPKSKLKPPQPAEPVVIETPEPPEYLRATSPALPEGQALADTDGELEGSGNKMGKPSEPNTRKRRRQPAAKEPIKRAEPKVAAEPIVEVSEGIEPSTEQIPTKAKAKRGPKPGYKKKTLGEAARTEAPTEGPPAESPRTNPKTPEDVEVAAAGDASENLTSIPKVDKPQDKPKAKRKKRKSIGQQSGRAKPKAKHPDNFSMLVDQKVSGTRIAKVPKSTRTARASPNKQTAKTTRPPPPEVEEIDDGIDKPSDGEIFEPDAAPPKKRRGRPPKTRTSESEVPNPEVTQPQKRRGRPPKTAASQPPIPKPKPTKATPTSKPPANTIPITYYAPPSPSPSDPDPTIDPLSTTLTTTHYASKTINPVDVFAQTCSEMLSKTSTTLASKALENPAQKAEYMRRKETVDIYTEELSDRLFQLTTTLNANTALNAQFKKATAEERALKKEVKKLGAERERIRVRREEVLKGKKARELEELLSGIKGAVKRGWEMEAEATMAEG